MMLENNSYLREGGGGRLKVLLMFYFFKSFFINFLSVHFFETVTNRKMQKPLSVKNNGCSVLSLII